MDKRQGTRDRQSDEGLEASDGRGGGHWAHFSGAEKSQKIIRGFSWGPNEYVIKDPTEIGHGQEQDNEEWGDDGNCGSGTCFRGAGK